MAVEINIPKPIIDYNDLENKPTIPDVSGLVPYTGATADVDLGANGLDAKFVNVKGTGGAGHLGLKHQSSNATAGGQETVIFAGSDGEPMYKNDGGTVAQFASRAWVVAQGFITNVITALGFTPVPNTRTINGYDLTANRTLTASDVGAVATNSAVTGATKTKVTYDSKGLVTAGADATTADIADSSNKRYVTDSQLTVIGNTSGTNTGDQTFITPRLQSVDSSATVTPTSANDIVRITAQTEGLTLANPTGAFVEGQSLIIRIKDNGTARAITYGADYRAIGVTLPTTTVANKTTYLGCIYNSTDSKLDIVGVCTEV